MFPGVYEFKPGDICGFLVYYIFVTETKNKGENIMKNIIKKIIMVASVFGVAIVMAGCTSCPSRKPMRHNQEMHKQQKRHHNQMQQSPQITETVVFYQTYEMSDIDNVSAKMYTRNSRGGESKMGTIKFVETNDGLHMKTDLQDLRPGVTYAVKVYQCGTCNDWSCCETTPMGINLPNLRIDTAGRLQNSYVIHGLTAAQLNNAKLVLTRDGGYKAAWGRIKQ